MSKSKTQSKFDIICKDKYNDLAKRFYFLTDTKINLDPQSRNSNRHTLLEKLFSNNKRISDAYHIENKLAKLSISLKVVKSSNQINNKTSRKKSVLTKQSKSFDSVCDSKYSDFQEIYNDDSSESSISSNTELETFCFFDTTKAWCLLKDGITDCQPECAKISQLKYDFLVDNYDSVTSLVEHKIPYINNNTIENELLCHFCKELKANEKNYPCRICNRVFHLKCVEQKGLLRSKQEREILLQAFSNIGWSCHECSNLGNLLDHAEILELIEQFESSDVDNDHGIDCEEFLRIRKDEFLKQYGVEMSQDDIEVAKLRFQIIDNDKSGFIDWDEYLNYECMRRLHKVSAKDLVLKLTAKERQRARETFYSFDKDKGGTISVEEARRTFRHWFTFLYQNLLYQAQVDTHINVQTDLLMKSSVKRKSELTWEEYIQGQAIYILVNRPNNALGLIKDDKATNIKNQTTEKAAKNDWIKFSSIFYLDKIENEEKKNKTKNLNPKKIIIKKKSKYVFHQNIMKPLNREKWLLK